MTSPTKLDLDRVGPLYCRLMEEVRARDELLNTAVLHPFVPKTDAMQYLPNFHTKSVSEFCYIQLRMMCEAIALGCLAAHGDLEVGKLARSWQADDIVNGLERLHPDFYPKPSVQKKTGNLSITFPIKQGYLTKGELLRLYGECGVALHMGSYRALTKKSARAPDLDRIRSWSQQIWVLLSHHHMDLVNADFRIVCLMKPKETGRAQLSFWKRRADGLYAFDRAIQSS